VGLNWPEIASCQRKDMGSVTEERVGGIFGTYKDKSGRLVEGFQATFERGGTKLSLQCEIGDLENLDAKVVAALHADPQNAVINGRMAGLKILLDVMSLTRAKLQDGAASLTSRALKARHGAVEALQPPQPGPPAR
jgi:hypothetical protein